MKTFAEAGGRRFSVREVESAIERNPVAILIPSHRVLARSGVLADYPGGAPRKEHLLRLEGVLPARTFSFGNLVVRAFGSYFSSLL